MARCTRSFISIIGILGALAALAPAATADVTPVASCQALDSPRAYTLTADLTAVDATCIEITASDVTLNLAGHTDDLHGIGLRRQLPGSNLRHDRPDHCHARTGRRQGQRPRSTHGL